MSFSPEDINQIQSHGLTMELVNQQMLNYRNGFPKIRLAAPATVGNGILKLSKSQVASALGDYELLAPQHSMLKFVPASGAASRMFKDLFTFASSYFGVSHNFAKEFPEVQRFVDNLRNFPFYTDLKNTMARASLDIEEYLERGDYTTIINFLLQDRYLSYGSLPKALLKFHTYGNLHRTPFEEHLIEGANYAKDAQGIVRMHFTVSGKHRKLFESTLRQVRSYYQFALNVKYHISFSEQSPTTDQLAVDQYNEPVRDQQGRLIFHPGGHGSLLHNLNNLSADIVFIKNIDNVVPDWAKQPTFTYKKILAGLLMRLQQQSHGYLRMMSKSQLEEKELLNIEKFVQTQLMIDLGSAFCQQNLNSRQQRLVRLLNRPMRVCGMVRNQGEPGGGPFWVLDEDGSKSLQIVEANQINRNDPTQEAILRQSTHFNPVDLVCGLRDYKGHYFNLPDYSNPNAGFIAKKSSGPLTLKTQELPGLWNGAMADWITLFVEVPIETFSPVKSVNDLLRPEHMPAPLR
ncbi:MAG: DUF4301 family protein [Bacteroidales bacterium]|nr:DUF4301 family protein [Candidatus Colimorpha onthohippi]